MSYTTLDFSESLRAAGLTRAAVARVIAAWGTGSGMGEDAGHFKWAEDGATEWRGGFLMALRDGAFVYLTGWCDYTGWGCQDGAEAHWFGQEPELPDCKGESGNEPPASEWDLEPADLNRWLATPDDPEG